MEFKEKENGSGNDISTAFKDFRMETADPSLEINEKMNQKIDLKHFEVR